MKIRRNSLNLYNTSETVWQNGYKGPTGSVVSSPTDHFTTNFTEVEPETTYYLAGTISSHRIYFYDVNQDWIGRTDLKGTRTFTTPANCKYVQFQMRTSTVTSTDDWMLTKGDTAHAYEPYNVVDWYDYQYYLNDGTWTPTDEKQYIDGVWT